MGLSLMCVLLFIRSRIASSIVRTVLVEDAYARGWEIFFSLFTESWRARSTRLVDFTIIILSRVEKKAKQCTDVLSAHSTKRMKQYSWRLSFIWKPLCRIIIWTVYVGTAESLYLAIQSEICVYYCSKNMSSSTLGSATNKEIRCTQDTGSIHCAQTSHISKFVCQTDANTIAGCNVFRNRNAAVERVAAYTRTRRDYALCLMRTSKWKMNTTRPAFLSIEHILLGYIHFHLSMSVKI